jgi:hypothetical protein
MIGTHVLCVYVEWWSWLLVVLQACHAATFYACVGHATVHVCLSVSSTGCTADNPESHSI